MKRPSRMLPALLLLTLVVSAVQATQSDFVSLPGGRFTSALRFEDQDAASQLAPFALMRRPVTHAEFARFVQSHPQWRRDRLPAVFASAGYLADWASADGPGDGVDANAPVTRISWYAADAYCRAQSARLPTFLEWEFAAAADATRTDARSDAQRRIRLLADATPRALDAGNDAANAWGVHGLHGAHWEWTEDYAALLSINDRRGGDDGDALKFCGATSLAFSDLQQYDVMKRFAVLSALGPGDALPNLGFRCARSTP